MSRSGAPLAVVWSRDVVGPSAVREVTGKRRSRFRFDPAELVVLAAFAVMSAWVLLLGLWWTVTQGRIWTGVNGVYVQDVTQYLAWIRDGSRHVLVSDLFVSRSTPHDYLQPAIAVSGGLVAIGVAPWLALLLWQPVAVGGTFLAVRSLVHGQLRARRARRAALVLALFGGSIGTFQDLWLPWWTWGYVFGVLSLATMVASLLLYDRAVRGAAPVWPPAVLAGLASWLHPWQGAVLALTIVGAEIMVLNQPPGSPGGPRRRSLARPALALVAMSLPLAYYAVLGRVDAAWRLAGESLKGGVPVWHVLVMLAPLLAPALLAYRIGRGRSPPPPYESGRRPRSLSTSPASTGSETSRCTPSSASASRWRSSPHRAWAAFAGLGSRRDRPLWCSPCSHSPCPRP